MRLDDIPRVHLAVLPTPLDEAPRLAAELGLDRLLIKRDDNTGLATGGNKARKLEFLMAEAQAMGVDVVITCGGAQSNHARMTAAAARKLGMRCVMFLTDPMPDRFEGNLLLDTILEAEMRFIGNVTLEELDATMKREADRLESEGHTPYIIPIGGSTGLGAMGYVNAVREISQQLAAVGADEVDIVTAYGSGGTAAGLIVGCHLFLPKARVYAISVSRGVSNALPRVTKIAGEAWRLLGMDDEPRMDMLSMYDQYVGPGYAIPTDEGREAILLAARAEGIILDPVYTGKAMAGLIDLSRKGEIGRGGRPVVFWHTGGAAGLFAHESLFHGEAVRLSS